MKRKKVLLPLDDSEFSRQVLTLVSGHFQPDTTDLVLLRVADMPHLPEGRPSPPALHGSALSYNDMKPRPASPYPIYLDELKASLEAELGLELNSDLQRLEAEGFKVTGKVRFGDPAKEIIDEVQQNYDLILMATHGRRSLSQVFLGSVAQKVLREAKVPVMMFKPERVEALV